MFFYIWDEDPARVNSSMDQSSKLYLRDTWPVLEGYYLYQRETWRETVPLANLDTSRELLDLIHDDDDQVTAPTPSLGSHGSGEGDSTYFTGERPSPHHLSVLSKFHNSTRKALERVKKWVNFELNLKLQNPLQCQIVVN